MKKFIFNIALFLAGVTGVFGTVSAVCGPLAGTSNSLDRFDRAPEILLLIACAVVMIYGLAQCIIELKKENELKK